MQIIFVELLLKRKPIVKRQNLSTIGDEFFDRPNLLLLLQICKTFIFFPAFTFYLIPLYLSAWVSQSKPTWKLLLFPQRWGGRLATNGRSAKIKKEVLHMAIGICPKCGNACDILFRWSYIHPETGEKVRSYTRPFPILICSCSSKSKWI